MDDRFTPRLFASRLLEMLDQVECSADVTDGLGDRLTEFLRPYAARLAEPEHWAHALS